MTIPILSIVKWASIAIVAALITYGVRSLYEFHNNEITRAVNTAKLKWANEEQADIDKATKDLKEQSTAERNKLQNELDIERGKVTKLQRELLIEHDLDRLLQAKPNLILSRVNDGTEKVLSELGDATQ